jgi:PAS domain S-box-containing protein
MMRYSGSFSPTSLVPDARARRLCLVVGWILLLGSVISVAGWLTATMRLLQPAVSYPPLPFASALAVGGLGLCMLGLSKNNWQMCAVSGLCVFALGIGALIQLVAGVDLGIGTLLERLAGNPAQSPPISLPPSTAVLLIFAGTGILALALRTRAEQNRLVAGTVGAIIVVLCLGILFTRQFWNSELQGSLLAGSALQALIACLLVGLCLVYITWSADPSAAASAPWVPLSVGIACLVTVLFLTRALSIYEREQVREQTAIASTGAWREVNRQLTAGYRMLVRISVSRPKPDQTDRWRMQLDLLFHDVDGLEAVGWTDAAGKVLQLDRASDSLPAYNDVVSKSFGAILGAIGPIQPNQRVFFPIGEDPARFGNVAPICVPGTTRCSGYVIAVINARELLRPILSDSLGGFQFAVKSGRRDVFKPADRFTAPLAWTERTERNLGGVIWAMSTWPTDQTLLRLRTGLPDLFLLLGLLVSAILPVTIRLAQMNWTRARLAERVRLNLALETATDGIWEWNITTGASLRSAALWRHLGYDPAAMQGERDSWTALIHPSDQRMVNTAMSNHLAGLTESYEAEYRIKDVDGDWHWVIDRGRVVERYASGAPRQVAGISADITERKRADQALEESERRFRICFESAQQGQMLLDLEGRVLEANRASLDISAAEMGAMKGQALWDGGRLVGRNAELRELFAGAMGGKPMRRELEFAADGDGRDLLLDVTLSPVFDGSGKVSQLLADIRDVTARRRTEVTLREVESLTTMGRLAARVAHEINNPLAGIQNAFLLIKNAVPSSHPHFAYVGAIEREIARIAGVTRQLYETYRPEHQIGETQLPALVGDAVALLEQINRDSRVRIATDLTRSPTQVPIPDAVLRQTVYNLVQNAVEASPSGSTVEVSAAVEEKRLVLRIRDRGPGIPAEIRARIFEPFFTTKPSSVKTGGMGIGLALVRRSVEALGGTIEILDREGGGTEFVVRMPLNHGPDA